MSRRISTQTQKPLATSSGGCPRFARARTPAGLRRSSVRLDTTARADASGTTIRNARQPLRDRQMPPKKKPAGTAGGKKPSAAASTKKRPAAEPPRGKPTTTSTTKTTPTTGTPGGTTTTTTTSVRGYWSENEENALKRAVRKHGIGAWEKMRNDPEFVTLRCVRHAAN